MAKKSEKKTEAPAVEKAQPPQRPVLETFQDLLYATWEEPELGVVCLYGPPQSGKTTLLKRLAEAQGRWVASFTPQSYAPEEIIGVHYRVNGRLALTQPPFIPADRWDSSEPGLVLVDELNLPRRENQSVLLRLFAERALGTNTLRPNIALAGAMNPPTIPLLEALLDRLIFVGFPLEGMDIAAHFGLRATSGLFRKHFTLNEAACYSFPDRPECPGAWRKLELWCAKRLFWSDPVLRRWIVHGLFPAKVAGNILADLEQDRPMSDPVEWAKRVPVAEAAAGFVDAMHAANAALQGVPFLDAVRERMAKDETGEWARIVAVFAQNPTAQAGTNNGATEDALDAGREAFLKALQESRASDVVYVSGN